MPKTAKRPATFHAKNHKNAAHPLARWRRDHGLTGEAFLEVVKKRLPRGAKIVDRATLSRYESGKIGRADPAFAAAVAKITEGAITYMHLCGPPRRARSQPRAR